MPEADKAKIIKLIHELAVTFNFPDIEIKDQEIELTPDGKVIFEPVMSIKYWLQKDGSISEDYPLSVHHRLNSAFTNAGFKVIEASPKGVKVESISKYEQQDNKESWKFSDEPCGELHHAIEANLIHHVYLYGKLQESKLDIINNFKEIDEQEKEVDKAKESFEDSFLEDVWKRLKSNFVNINHKQPPDRISKNSNSIKNLTTKKALGKVIMGVINFHDTIIDGAAYAYEIKKMSEFIKKANQGHQSLLVIRKGIWKEIEDTNSGLLVSHKKLEELKCFPPSSDIYNKYGRMIGELM